MVSLIMAAKLAILEKRESIFMMIYFCYFCNHETTFVLRDGSTGSLGFLQQPTARGAADGASC